MILDCTLRDGGYYVNWNFEKDLIHKYFDAVNSANIDIIEIGFRFFSNENKQFLGPFAYCNEEFIKQLPLPDETPIAVMINAVDIISYNDGIEQGIKKLFLDSKYSLVDIVRIATHNSTISECYQISEILKSLGYRVFLNIMQVDSISSDIFSQKISLVKSWNTIETIYFADSFGNMNPNSVSNYLDMIKEIWTGDIGFHAHDNKGLALSNSLSAMSNGAKYLDSTVFGMGRGAGNTKTESLCIELSESNHQSYFPEAFYELVFNDFQALHEKYKWGSNVYYQISARDNIHPSYVQELLRDNRYSPEQLISALKILKTINSSNFYPETMLKLNIGDDGSEYGTWSPSNWFRGKKVVIIGSGTTIDNALKELSEILKTDNFFCICLNINRRIPEKYIDSYVACNEIRIAIESHLYTKLNKPLIVPIKKIPEKIKRIINLENFHDFGFRVKKDRFEILNSGCIINEPLALGYAIAIANAGEADSIYLAGMDGYEEDDFRQKQMINLLKKYSELGNSVEISTLTKTSYPIKKSSFYFVNSN